MEFIKTERGGKKLLFEGYAYIIDRTRESKTYWRCAYCNNCNARLTTIDKVISRTPSEHSHPPAPIENRALKVKEQIKLIAARSEEMPSSIIDSATSDIPVTIAGALPKKDSLKRTVRRKRPGLKENELYKTPRGDNFLLFEYEEVSIFGTLKNLKILSKKSEWFCDGTFDSAPLGKQLYSIHALITENKTVPLLYCVTHSKSEADYDLIFNFIKEGRNVNVTSITVDFEKAAINSIKRNFPHVSIYGFFFTLGSVCGARYRLWVYNRGRLQLPRKCIYCKTATSTSFRTT